MLMALGGLLIVVSVVCQIMILIAAFQDEIWKGILGLFCSIYLIYFAAVEWENQNKWAIFGVWLGSALIGGTLWGMGSASAVRSAPGAPVIP